MKPREQTEDERFILSRFPDAVCVEQRWCFRIYLNKWARKSRIFADGARRSDAWKEAARLIRSMDSCDKGIMEGTLHSFEEAFDAEKAIEHSEPQ